jgi:hypothetical protein
MFAHSRSRSSPENDRAPAQITIPPGSDISPNYCGAGILPALLSQIRHISKLLWSRHLACAPLPDQTYLQIIVGQASCLRSSPRSDISPNYCGAGILPALLSRIRHLSKLLWSRHLACAPLPYQIWGE